MNGETKMTYEMIRRIVEASGVTQNELGFGMNPNINDLSGYMAIK